MRKEWKDLGRSFVYAFRGIQYAIREERNFRIHICAAITVIGVGMIYGCQRMEWALLFLVIASVMALELMNTSLEKTVDLAVRQWHRGAQIAKDCGAGMVLIEAIGSVAIAVCIFGDGERWRSAWQIIAPHWMAWSIGACLWVLIMVIFVFYFPSRGKEK